MSVFDFFVLVYSKSHQEYRIQKFSEHIEANHKKLSTANGLNDYSIVGYGSTCEEAKSWCRRVEKRLAVESGLPDLDETLTYSISSPFEAKN